MRYWLLAVVIFNVVRALRADELLFRYEGDVSPSVPSSGWQVFDPCDEACSESLADGHLIFSWPRNPSSGDRFVNYTVIIGVPPDVPDLPFWVEWRFASNNAIDNTTGNDGSMVVFYRGMSDLIDMYGDAIISHGLHQIRFGLPLDEFRTIRFEMHSEDSYCYWIDGVPFYCDPSKGAQSELNGVQMFGHGGVDQKQGPGPIINRWDHVRYGRVTSGESIVGSDPPDGVLDASDHPGLDRFTITFDQPNYVFVEEVSVEVVSPSQHGRAIADSGAGTDELGLKGSTSRSSQAAGQPVVIATKRPNNSTPETVEIVLDRPLAVGVTTRFTFDTDGSPNTIEYTLVELSPCCVPSGACVELSQEDCQTQNGSSASSVCEADGDGDGLDGSCGDGCPADPVKLAPGMCGCGISDADSDSDGVADCLDQCPAAADEDSDADSVLDCADVCPGQDDRIDKDANGTSDCLEDGEIPTTTFWGLVVLALLLAIGAKVILRPAYRSPV